MPINRRVQCRRGDARIAAYVSDHPYPRGVILTRSDSAKSSGKFFYPKHVVYQLIDVRIPETKNPAEFQQGLPFLLNFRDAHIRYYRHKEEQSHAVA